MAVSGVSWPSRESHGSPCHVLHQTNRSCAKAPLPCAAPIVVASVTVPVRKIRGTAALVYQLLLFPKQQAVEEEEEDDDGLCRTGPLRPSVAYHRCRRNSAQDLPTTAWSRSPCFIVWQTDSLSVIDRSRYLAWKDWMGAAAPTGASTDLIPIHLLFQSSSCCCGGLLNAAIMSQQFSFLL